MCTIYDITAPDMRVIEYSPYDHGEPVPRTAGKALAAFTPNGGEGVTDR